MTPVSFSAAETGIAGLVVLTLKQVSDGRGTVREVFRASDLGSLLDPPVSWSQLNITASRRGVVRGLHGEETTKLVTVAAGSAFGAWLDARPGSPTFGRVETRQLAPGTAVLVGAGICNGFQATGEEWTEYCYCFDSEWRPGMPGRSVNPFDPALAIAWPIPVDPADPALVSEKDAGLPRLAELDS